jgi:hypothetical protein
MPSPAMTDFPKSHHHRGFAVAGAADRIVTLFKVARVDTILPSFATQEAAEQTGQSALNAVTGPHEASCHPSS